MKGDKSRIKTINKFNFAPAGKIRFLIISHVLTNEVVVPGGKLEH